MQKNCVLSAVLFLVVGNSAFAQNAGAHPTPQTQGAAPAKPSTESGSPPASGAVRNSGTQPGAASRSVGRSTGRSGGSRRGVASKSQGSPAAAANSSVGVLGDANGDGILDRSGKGADSAALPGIPMVHNAMGIAAGTPISVRLQQSIDSGHAHNGDTVRGVLAAALGRIPSGAQVSLTVVAAAPAGQLSSNGTLSLQVVSVNGEQVLSQVITAEGKQGATVLADDAPARGTEAVFTADQPITLPAA